MWLWFLLPKPMIDVREKIIDAEQLSLFNWRELWEYRELFYFFTWRDVKVKYKQTVLGILWVIIQPLLQVAIFSITVGRLMPANDTERIPYPLFVFSGFLFWNMFSSSVSNGGSSMLSQAPIIKKIYFPRVIIPISSILVSGFDFFVAFIVFVGMVIAFSTPLDLIMAALCWPVAFVLLFTATLGIGSWLAALTVKYRDFRFIVPFALQIGLFVSPVIYPLSIFSDGFLKDLLSFNPIYAPLHLFRMPFLVGPPDYLPLLYSTVSIVVILIFGLYYFGKTEAYFADIA
jgi:lipopolysaccharide transport system permease protein